jgi:hypothetical protein
MIIQLIIVDGRIIKNSQELPKVKKKMHNNIRWQKNIIHFNNVSMDKHLLSKHGGERMWGVQTFTFVF